MSEPFDEELRDQHIAESRARLPGPSYYHVLMWIHAALRPSSYLEIGIRRGMSLGAAQEGTSCVGVDPEPLLEREFANTRVFPVTSDEFFASEDVGELFGGPLDLAFIDGLHLFEQVLRDFINVERNASPHTVVLLHDSLPFDEVTAGRERVTDFYSGDVWKAVLAIRRLRPELEMATVPAAPTGLTLVRGLDRSNEKLAAEFDAIVAQYLDLDTAYLEEHRADMPGEIPNSEEAVRRWLRSASVPQD
jgi:Methyltransferase domain